MIYLKNKKRKNHFFLLYRNVKSQSWDPSSFCRKKRSIQVSSPYNKGNSPLALPSFYSRSARHFPPRTPQKTNQNKTFFVASIKTTKVQVIIKKQSPSMTVTQNMCMWGPVHLQRERSGTGSRGDPQGAFRSRSHSREAFKRSCPSANEGRNHLETALYRREIGRAHV